MSKKIHRSELNVNDIVVRAGKTFLQAFFATLAVQIAGVNNTDMAVAAVVAAAAAGISAVMNTAAELIRG